MPKDKFSWLLAVVALLALTSVGRAAAPRDELLRLVPEDVGFCLVVQDLRSHSEALLASPFVKVLRLTPGTIPAELQKLDEIDKQVEQFLGVSWAKVRDDVLGDCVVLAYRPAPAGKSGQEQGLVLVWARDPKLLADLVEHVNRLQKLTGDLKDVTERDYRGQKYSRRVEKKGEGFYYLRGPLLVFATQEELLRQAIDRQATPAEGEAPLARQLRLLGADKKLAALWVNPRAFDAEMERSAAAAHGAEAAFLKNFLRYWKAVDGVAVSATVESDFQLELAVRARNEDLPPTARRFLAEAAKPSELWGRFGDDAILALASRVDFAALFELAGDFLTPEDRLALRSGLEGNLKAVLDRDLVKDVLPWLGPDCGLLVTAPPSGERAWFPHVVLAVAARPGEDGDAPVDRLLLSALEFAAQLVVVGYNHQHTDQLALKTTTLDKVRIKYLTGDQGLPPGLQPAFALQNGYLVLATSPEVLRQFVQPPSTGAPGKSVPHEVPLLRLSVKNLRAYLKERFEPVAAYVAEKNGIPREEAEGKLKALLNQLLTVDQIELSQRTEKGQVNLTLRVRLILPLK